MGNEMTVLIKRKKEISDWWSIDFKVTFDFLNNSDYAIRRILSPYFLLRGGNLEIRWSDWYIPLVIFSNRLSTFYWLICLLILFYFILFLGERVRAYIPSDSMLTFKGTRTSHWFATFWRVNNVLMNLNNPIPALRWVDNLL